MTTPNEPKSKARKRRRADSTSIQRAGGSAEDDQSQRSGMRISAPDVPLDGVNIAFDHPVIPLVDIDKALSMLRGPKCFEILAVLSARAMNVTQLTTLLGYDASEVSRRLTGLRASHLARDRKEGKESIQEVWSEDVVRRVGNAVTVCVMDVPGGHMTVTKMIRKSLVRAITHLECGDPPEIAAGRARRSRKKRSHPPTDAINMMAKPNPGSGVRVPGVPGVPVIETTRVAGVAETALKPCASGAKRQPR